MGQRLIEFYNRAQQIGGIQAKVKIAMLTKIPSTRAGIEPDSPENIKKFEEAFSEIYTTSPAPTPPQPMSPVHAKEHIEAPAPRGKELQESEAWFWGILFSMTESMVMVFDRGGNCLFAWESLSKKYGLDWVRKSEQQLTHIVQTKLFEENRAEVMQTFEGKSSRFELGMSLSWGYVWHDVSISPMIGGTGDTLAVAFFRDITENKQAEEAVRENERRLRRHNTTFLEVVRHKSVYLGDVKEAIRRITEAAATTFEIARAGVWFYNGDQSAITCADLFEYATGKHSVGNEMSAAEFPTYFKALLNEGTIAAHDANNDPRTREFSEPYLKPLGINSTLDVPIWVGGKMVGVLCHEHIGPKRQWTLDEENFAYLMANFVSLSLEVSQRKHSSGEFKAQFNSLRSI